MLFLKMLYIFQACLFTSVYLFSLNLVVVENAIDRYFQFTVSSSEGNLAHCRNIYIISEMLSPGLTVM